MQTTSNCSWKSQFTYVLTFSFPPPKPPHPVRRRCRRRWAGPGGCPSWYHPLFPPPSPALCGTDTVPGKTDPRVPTDTKLYIIILFFIYMQLFISKHWTVIQKVRTSLEAQIWCSEHILHFQNITKNMFRTILRLCLVLISQCCGISELY